MRALAAAGRGTRKGRKRSRRHCLPGCVESKDRFGLEKMVENDAYCPDILVQSSAATSALNSFNKVLLGCHIRSCVAEDIRSGKDETVDELCELLQRLMK